MKIGRNAPCWCGSGKKFKKCHLDRDKQTPISEQTLYKQFNSFYSQKYCSVPEPMKDGCSGKIVKAHSISKSSSLKEISSNGHVLTTFKTGANFNNGFDISPQKIGLQKASTFTGFCNYHDNHLFQPIEKKDFEISEENCFLVAYRALTREIFVKEKSAGTFDLLKNLDKGKSIDQQISIQAGHKWTYENNDLTKNDLEYLKKKMDSILLSKDYSGVSHIVFTLAEPPMVMTSAAVAPRFDFQGKELQKISMQPEKIPSYIIVNSFSSASTGYICLSCIDEHIPAADQFYASLCNSKSIEDSLTAFIFLSIENNYLSEEWWSGLGKPQKSYIENLFSQGVTTPTVSDALIDTKDLGAFEIENTKLLNMKN
ncbi:SEC-C domain-containing protein [Microbulbifer bruguierae]|uniref:SEC-C domain-containing protein n=1 Tax=Microbulbifer bruguierae TaxID=3029061 RepID=A0ABY8NGE6_9GAMM|nr:SEC-C domain-containing protein [Microbulbifer bruguierae]WGL16802.1 SEC-C domain-containing protein [Microbulbifer bruguierae]